MHLLERQAALHPVLMPGRPTEDSEWLIVELGFVATRERDVESLFALGNGLIGERVSLGEGSPLSSASTFVAGLFHARAPGEPLELFRAPDWTRVVATIDGDPVRIDHGEILEHRRILDLRQGCFWRHWRQRDPSGRITTVQGLRVVSQANRHLLMQSVAITAENFSGRLAFEAYLAHPVLRRTSTGEAAAVAPFSWLETPTSFGGRILAPAPTTDERLERYEIDIEQGRTYRLDRVAVIDSTRETPDPLPAATRHLKRVVRRQDPESLLEAHTRAWRRLWNDADVRIRGAPDAERALRFAIYHLLSAVNPNDEGVSVGARALTGPIYRGHVFWDTEAFMVPFYALTWPRAARSLLRYRYRGLPAARARAKQFGYRGAMYPWESAASGEDVTPEFVLAPDGEMVPIRVGALEQHISADIAWAVWLYWRASGDDRFLRETGAEIVLETARFWASRVEPGNDGRWHLNGVIGPDEYHESVDDDAFTNGMAQWNLERAAELAGILRDRWPATWRELTERLQLRAEEPAEWLRTASAMYTGFDPRTGLFEQFRGYYDLQPLDLADYEPRTAPLDLILPREQVQRSRVIKQADVVMLLHLLGDRFPASVRRANFQFYEPQTDHGSSLSPPVHAAVASRIGELEVAGRYLRQTMEIDLLENMGNSAGGVHAAALGGLWQAVVHGFAGLELTSTGPRLDPQLPARWRSLELAVRWRGRRVELHATGPAGLEAGEEARS